MLEFIGANWELVGICFGILVNLAGLVYNIYRFCSAGKLKALQNMTALFEAAREYELQAEKYQGYSSAEKLNYVLSRLRVLAGELGCTFDEEEMVARIEADIAYAKGVNAAPHNDMLE
ncbi:MAG: hypothetical protein E7650_06330 [Ruminococcaceae bacterium]|nr:hypothetical protein [Oscillospiraceae bacterium]MBQ2757363.1 hypothetical protein [Clostridia bacterium]